MLCLLTSFKLSRLLALFVVFLLLKPCKLQYGDVPDYWNEDFDENKNCNGGEEAQDELLEIVNTEPESCATTSAANSIDGFFNCAAKLVPKVKHKCIATSTKSTGKLLTKLTY